MHRQWHQRPERCLAPEQVICLPGASEPSEHTPVRPIHLFSPAQLGLRLTAHPLVNAPGLAESGHSCMYMAGCDIEGLWGCGLQTFWYFTWIEQNVMP